MRYLGIDYGSRKTGLALSDESGQMGFPHEVVPTSILHETLSAMMSQKEIGAVVIGESKDLGGHFNPIHVSAKELEAWIKEHLKLPVYWESEIFTSAEARRMHTPAEKTRKPVNHDDVDASAAALILTSYLSRTHG